MDKTYLTIPSIGTIALLSMLAVFILNSCASSGSDSQTVQTKQDVSDPANAITHDQVAEPLNTNQAMEILAKSEQYLNPVGGESGQDTGSKPLSIPQEGASESPRNDGIHDNQVNSIATLQDPSKALADFPRDRRHQVDWVAALDQGLIDPRADLLGETQMQTMDMDILMKNTQFMPWVKFPHLQHTKWLACSNCHPAIFIPKQDANPISMNKVLRGEYCGVCHDKVAFALFICERCHSVPHEGSGEKWW